MKDFATTMLAMILVYFIVIALVFGVSIIMVALSSLMTWNTALLTPEIAFGLLIKSSVIGLVFGSFMIGKDFDGLRDAFKVDTTD